MEAVADVVAHELDRWDVGRDSVEWSVFGTDDPGSIAAMVGSLCLDSMGSPPTGGLFYRSSAGCVLGVRLETGVDVVVKAYQARWSAPFLRAVQTGQTRAAEGGIPCAVPLGAPVSLPGRPNLAVVESWFPDPGMQPPQTQGARRVSAAGLSRQIRVSGPPSGVAALSLHPLRGIEGRLYGEPHSPLFDFDATREGAEWIDDLAHEAKRRRDVTSPDVVAHTDWSARNVRLDDAQVVAVYDWDSLALVTEMTALGQAAMTWSVTAEPGGSDFPTLADVSGYIRDYEAARGHELSPAEWRAAGAAAAWVLAYTARCEHALDARGRARPDQHGARARLGECGDALLSLSRP